FVEATGYKTDAEKEGWGNVWNGEKMIQTKASWNSPGFVQSDDHPVVMVSYNDAAAFAKWIGGRLPSEAEWEYAARAGAKGEFEGDISTVAWHKGNLRPEDRTSKVGQKKPNAWGLYDMLGNAWERIEDWYDKTYYQNSPAVDPPGPSLADLKGNRGGGWIGNARADWYSFRGWGGVRNRDPVLGFRVVVDAKQI
ncbi:MAG: formylglycine-generating enzyme family protein, partial [Pyrinomonadaceae bacterium]